MRKKITKVSPMPHGHVMLEFEDGTKQTVFRGCHEPHAPAVGDLWPPDGHEHVTSGVQTGKLERKSAPPSVSFGAKELGAPEEQKEASSAPTSEGQ